MSAREKVREIKSKLEMLRDDISFLQNSLSKMNGGPNDSLKASAEKLKILPLQTNFKKRLVLLGHYGKVYNLHWQPEPKDHDEAVKLVSVGQDGHLIIWNGLTSKKLKTIRLYSSWVMGCAYAPGGRFVASGGLDNICTIHSTDGNETVQMGRHEGWMSSCRFLNDDEVFSASGDATIVLWDIRTQKLKMTFDAHSSMVMAISISPDKKLFVSGSCDKTLKVFEIGSGQCVASFKGHTADVDAVDWCFNGHSLASGSDDSTMRLWDMRAYAQLNHYTDTEIMCGATSVCFSESGKYLFTGYDDDPYAVVWDTVSAFPTQKFTQLDSRVSCVGLQSDGYALCTGSWDFNLRIYA